MVKKNMYDMYSKMDWSETYKEPMTSDYQPKNSEFVNTQFGKTLDYIPKRDSIQTRAASQVRSQEYKGRYE